MRRSIAPTLQDVAREAGVSAMTVSVVLNGARSATRVSDATRSRIHEAAARLRYRPNAVARGLSRRRMDAIGVVALIDGGELNLYFLEVLNGILEGAAANHQNTTIYSVEQWSDIQSHPARYCDGRADGLIFIAPTLTPEAAEAIRQRHMPFVLIHSATELPGLWNLTVDNQRGAYAAVSHLLQQGHRRILHFPGTKGVHDTEERRIGYQRALEDAGVPLDPALIVPGTYSVWSGRERMVRVLTEGLYDPAPPTALFCGSDAIAAGALEALAEQGVRVPEDLSVVGFDDTLMARMTAPPLTTVRQPFRQIGRHAVERLLPLISSGGSADPAGSESAPSATPAELSPPVFDVELVVRSSVGQPPNRHFVTNRPETGA